MMVPLSHLNTIFVFSLHALSTPFDAPLLSPFLQKAIMQRMGTVWAGAHCSMAHCLHDECLPTVLSLSTMDTKLIFLPSSQS